MKHKLERIPLSLPTELRLLPKIELKDQSYFSAYQPWKMRIIEERNIQQPLPSFQSFFLLLKTDFTCGVIQVTVIRGDPFLTKFSSDL
jgi:hypothetical protein